MTTLECNDLRLLDFLCAVEARSHCRVRSVKTRLRPSLRRLRYAGLVWFDGFTPSASAMADWRARHLSPPSPGGAAGEEQPTPKAAEDDGGAVARIGSAPPRQASASAAELMAEINAWLAANPKCTKTNFARLALGRAGGVCELERSHTLRAKTIRRVREFIANPPAEAFTRKRGRKSQRDQQPAASPPFQPTPLCQRTPAKPPEADGERLRRANARRGDAVRRSITRKAKERIEKGLDARGARSANVRHAQFALEQEIALQNRLADPIEQAKHLLRKRYTPVLNAETDGGPKGMFVVGRKLVDEAELLAMARRLAA